MALVVKLSERAKAAAARHNERLHEATTKYNAASALYHEEIEAANLDFEAEATASVNGFVNEVVGEMVPVTTDPDPDAGASLSAFLAARRRPNGIIPALSDADRMEVLGAIENEIIEEPAGGHPV